MMAFHHEQFAASLLLSAALSMSCSIFMGNIDVPTQTNQPLKMPMGTYEFGANLVSSKVRDCTVALALHSTSTCMLSPCLPYCGKVL